MNSVNVLSEEPSKLKKGRNSWEELLPLLTVNKIGRAVYMENKVGGTVPVL